MSSSDDTTLHDITEGKEDKLLILNGLERLEYFDTKPKLEQKGFRDYLRSIVNKHF